MIATFDEVIQRQIDREAVQAAQEHTPASMKPRHLRNDMQEALGQARVALGLV